MAFEKAERKRAKLKLAVIGPSGSGKTFSSLEIARGLGKKIAVADTENDSASLYSDRFDFDVAIIKPPYEIKKYKDVINDAVKAGYDVLVLDSISHAWSGAGGILDKKAALDSRGGNSYTNWKNFTPEQESFIAAILNAPIHIICTMRSKQEYALEETRDGKKAPVKLGMAPVQRDGMEYEFTLVLDLDMKHTAKASKDRTGLFDDKFFVPTPETGETLLKWLNSGKDVSPTNPPQPETPINETAGEVTPPDDDGEPFFDDAHHEWEQSNLLPQYRRISTGQLSGLTFEEALKKKLGLELAKWAWHESNTGNKKIHPDLVALAAYAESLGYIKCDVVPKT